ncbi:phage terminase large subunit [Sphingobium sp. AS12]|uniref:phage terminase large subunit n=1 Tax=Sphingobium sp. AS12 TaxID=2849495 RepID=UPI001C3190CA|nr:phage terminase large subunit [Sphingobium sp. AS12]MBV2150175.1 phage terminase large subunit [Sphingobium sp. AS12]
MAGEAKQTKGIRPNFDGFNEDQWSAYKLATTDGNKFHLFYGGAGSGKSWLILFIVLLRAIRARNTRHAIFRLTRNSCEQTLFNKTLYEVLDAGFPGLREQIEAKGGFHHSKLMVTLPNGSEIYFNGLDENRTSKVLGDEFNTVWLNECNEDGLGYAQVSTLMSRLRMRSTTEDGALLKNKMFFDCNPRFYSDWEYKAFILHVNPEDGDAMPREHQWVSQKLRTESNIDNLSPDYVEGMETMGAGARRRYLEGEWSDENTNALFIEKLFVDYRIPRPETVNRPALVLAMLAEQGIELNRITVCSDPATKGNVKNDLHGITVQGKAGYGKDAHAYVLADYSCHGSPIEVCDIIAKAYKEWGASRVVMEDNAGGRWLESTIIQHSPHLPLKFVNANTRTGDKTARAEPVAGMYEQGKVHHVGTFRELEAQMCDWGSPASRKKSPDRMDAVVWGIIELLDLHQEAKPDPSGGAASRYRRLR